MSKQKEVSIVTVKPASGREANPIIMDDGSFSLDGFTIPKLGIHVEGKQAFVKHMFLLGLCKVLGDNVANEKDKPAAIQQTFEAWNHGYPTFAAWEKSKRATVAVVSGKTVKLQYTQLQVSAALRDTLGADDNRVRIVESMNDELFVKFMELKAGEQYMVDAIAILRKQDEEKAKLEQDKLAAELAALGL